MSDPLTKTVKALSALNQNMKTFASTSSNPKYFPKVALAVIFSSGLFGYGLLQIVDQKREANASISNSNSKAEESIVSHNESLVRAMIENAKSSSTRENLENAAMAQKNFMLVPFDKSVTEGVEDQRFLRRIAKRGEEIRSRKEESAERGFN